jgi:cytochrome P450
VLDIILSGAQMPPGLILFEDPPAHDVHRRMLSRVFTPRRMVAIEPLARKFTVAALDSLRGADKFDFIEHLGSWMPMRTIGTLLGIPDQDQQGLRDNTDEFIELKRGQHERPTGEAGRFTVPNYDDIGEYVDWRAEHPSDDLMSDLIHAQIESDDGTLRQLTRDEVLTYVSTIMGAGSETTTRLIGFTGQLLGDHPDARRELARDHSLIPQAIEEVLRYEAPSPVQGRYVQHDIRYHGSIVPEGSIMLLVNAAANRDERKHSDPDRFDIHRQANSHLSFGQGLHFCLGAALARMEARVALEEVLDRWPDWEIDYSAAKRAHTSSVRGWASLPATVSRG